MTDSYKGTKFKTRFIAKGIIEELDAEKLQQWGRIFHREKMAPRENGGSAGNLSFRTKKGFVITASGSDLGSLESEDFVSDFECDLLKKEVGVVGMKNPSSETLMHHQIYKKRKDVKAILHGHDGMMLRHHQKLGLVCTEHEKPYGTLSLVVEVMKVLGKNNFIILKNHGFLSLGRTIDEAGKRAIGYKNMIYVNRKKREL